MKKEAFAKALKAQAEFIKWMDLHNKWDGCTSFAIVHPTHTFMCPQTNCFASMAAQYNKEVRNQPSGLGNGKGAIAFIVGLQMAHEDFGEDEEDINARKREEQQGNIRYLDWVLNRSPWSSAFSSKSAKWCFRKRSVILEMDVPSNLMVGGGVAVRRLWETVSVKQTWLDMTAEGVQEDLAYFLASSAEFTNQAKLVKWGSYEKGHMNLSVHNLTLADLLAFLQHKPFHLNNSYSVDQSYQGYSIMFCKDGVPLRTVERAQKWIVNNFPFKDKGEIAPPINPFAKAIVAPKEDYIEVEEGTRRWVDFQYVLFKAIGFEPKQVVAK